MGAAIIVDAFWGDAGKGKMCVAYAKRLSAGGAVRTGAGSNAGHSVYLQDGTTVVARMLPLGWLGCSGPVMIGSGVCVDPSLVVNEISRWNLASQAVVDYRCPIITEECIHSELGDSRLQEVGSTNSGSGWARAQHVLRHGKTAGDMKELLPYLGDVAKQANEIAATSQLIVEGSQATFLSLYLSGRYPYCTSVNCTSAAFIDQVGLSWKLVNRVALLVKCLPTSVGPGPLPNEMSAYEIEQRGLIEYGNNTGRPRRRVKAIDWSLLEYSVMLNGPTEIVLTHCEQYDPLMKDVAQPGQITDAMHQLIEETERRTGLPVVALEHGKLIDSILWLT